MVKPICEIMGHSLVCEKETRLLSRPLALEQNDAGQNGHPWKHHVTPPIVFSLDPFFWEQAAESYHFQVCALLFPDIELKFLTIALVFFFEVSKFFRLPALALGIIQRFITDKIVITITVVNSNSAWKWSFLAVTVDPASPGSCPYCLNRLAFASWPLPIDVVQIIIPFCFATSFKYKGLCWNPHRSAFAVKDLRFHSLHFAFLWPTAIQ